MSRSTPAGWYPQPDGTERYWGGDSWSDQVRAATYQPAGPPSMVQDSPYAAPPPAQPFGAQPYGPHGFAAAQPPPGRMSGPYGPDSRQVVVAKSPAGALIASFFVPGLGQLINGEVGKGVAMFLLSLLSWALVLLIVPLLGIVGVWIWSMIDAYTGAQRWNYAHGIIS